MDLSGVLMISVNRAAASSKRSVVLNFSAALVVEHKPAMQTASVRNRIRLS
jgi:hypothetical protein